MPIKYNPYHWDIRKKELSCCPAQEDVQKLRKDLVEELHDAVNQPYIIEEDIESLIIKLYFLFCSPE